MRTRSHGMPDLHGHHLSMRGVLRIRMLSTSAHVSFGLLQSLSSGNERTNERTNSLPVMPAGSNQRIGLDWFAIIFGFDADAYVDVEELPNEAQRYARSFQRGEITQNELRARAERMQTSQLDGILTS